MNPRPMLRHVGAGLYLTPPLTENCRNIVRRHYRAARERGEDRHRASLDADSMTLTLLSDLARYDRAWEQRERAA